MKEDLLKRAQGCMMGQFVGDSLGAQCEFYPSDFVKRAYPTGIKTMRYCNTWKTAPGQITDDSELAIRLMHSLIQDGFNIDLIALNYCDWMQNDPFPTGTTIQTAFSVLDYLNIEKIADECRKRANPNSKSNGSLMRISPLAIFANSKSSEEIEKMARQEACLSHPNYICQDANIFYCLILAGIIKTGRIDVKHSPFYCPEIKEAIYKGMNGELIGPIDGEDQGYCIYALNNAIYQLNSGKDFRQALSDTIMRGGDTDTNAAIAGALIGAFQGIDAIPKEWTESVLNCKPHKGNKEIERPRNFTLWPQYAFKNVEKLIG